MTPRWPEVNCCACLELAPPFLGREERRAEATRLRFREWRDSPREPIAPVEMCVRCAKPAEEPGLWVCVLCASPLCRDCGDASPSECGWCR